MSGPDEILDFWLNEVGEKGWYLQDDDLDAQITARFRTAWEEALNGGHTDLLCSARGTLAYLILTDQFPRNMFRGDGRAFASDAMSLMAAKTAIERKWDMKIDAPERQFFYLPLMHSESLCDQERCVRLMKERMSESGASNLLHARAHREVIRQFGRFPYRNAALARNSTGDELAYVQGGGYGATLRQLQAAE